MSSYAIVLNGKDRRTRRYSAITGQEIRVLFAVPRSHQLTLCSASLEPDRLLHDEDAVSLRSGDIHVFTSRLPTEDNHH